ncbi:MAG: hypothetical protein HC906_11490 [Bacteroidales bacterium]|nr:hypothetical protein [Bacteroidales bacterium]
MMQKLRFETKSNDFKRKLLYWCSGFPFYAFIDRNSYNKLNTFLIQYDVIAAVKSGNCLLCNSSNAFRNLKEYQNAENNWLFGIFGYDLKNELEQLHSNHFDGIGFHDLQFSVPIWSFWCQAIRSKFSFS